MQKPLPAVCSIHHCRLVKIRIDRRESRKINHGSPACSLPDTGYDNPCTVLSEYYRDFNSQIASLEEQGYTITYQNNEDGVPFSNFDDTLMVYMVKYGTGQAAYIMDDEGKKHLKEVFDEKIGRAHV